MAKTAKEYALFTLAESREMTVGLLADIPADKLLHQPFEGTNHALWIMGHLAVTDDWLAGLYDDADRKLPEAYGSLFAMGSEPVNDPAAYPAPAEVRQHFDAAHTRMLNAVEAASDAKLAEPLPDDIKDFAPDKLAMALSLAWHEGLHTGQLTVIRKSLGIGPKYA